tara:strand:+ start:8471 stop:9310 length:840 start_codon:yes stop_codon:yes gene_type:complete
MNVIGVGQAGCKISNYLSSYSVYDTYQIDVEDDDYKNFVPVKPQADHEKYENGYTNLKLGKLAGETTIILCGAGCISGIILRLLEQISSKAEVDILYIKPRESEMSSLQTLQHKVCSQVLQQYVRSNMIKSIVLVDNEKIETIVPGVEIDNYWQPINCFIGDTFHMINVLQNTEALLKSSNQVPATAKIKTLSVVNLEEKKEEVFYDLEYPRAKNFYFALSEEYMKDNKELLSEVRGYVADQQTEKCDTAYAIYKTDYEQNYVYGIHHATFVQEQNLDL